MRFIKESAHLVLRPKVCEIPVLVNAQGRRMLITGNLLPFLRRTGTQDLLFLGSVIFCPHVWAAPVVLNPMRPNHDTGVQVCSGQGLRLAWRNRDSLPTRTLPVDFLSKD